MQAASVRCPRLAGEGGRLELAHWTPPNFPAGMNAAGNFGGVQWSETCPAQAARFLTARHTCCYYAEKNAVLLNSYDDVHLWGGAEALPSTALQA